MDIGLFRGVLTVILFLAFIGMWIWAWSSKRQSDFEQAANLPLEDVPPGVGNAGSRQEEKNNV
jgi:cytochrome c oxidase cbb3-type subunit 4